MASSGDASYDDVLRLLEAELAVVADGFERLAPEQWRTPTRLLPLDQALQPWTLLELAGHLDVSIGITSLLIADAAPDAGVAAKDAVDFFVFPSADVPSEFHEYAFEVVEGTDPATMAARLRATFAQVLVDAGRANPSAVGAFPGFEPNPLMRIDEFVSSRIVEAVVHGIDLTDALGVPPTATPAGIAQTAALLDELLARTRNRPRPSDLGDDLRWVRAATGREPHPDSGLPLLD
jgi:Mycothiol maleylpyruvate isomerase N-terminal domain